MWNIDIPVNNEDTIIIDTSFDNLSSEDQYVYTNQLLLRPVNCYGLKLLDTEKYVSQLQYIIAIIAYRSNINQLKSIVNTLMLSIYSKYHLQLLLKNCVLVASDIIDIVISHHSAVDRHITSSSLSLDYLNISSLLVYLSNSNRNIAIIIREKLVLKRLYPLICIDNTRNYGLDMCQFINDVTTEYNCSSNPQNDLDVSSHWLLSILSIPSTQSSDKRIDLVSIIHNEVITSIRTSLRSITELILSNTAVESSYFDIDECNKSIIEFKLCIRVYCLLQSLFPSQLCKPMDMRKIDLFSTFPSESQANNTESDIQRNENNSIEYVIKDCLILQRAILDKCQSYHARESSEMDNELISKGTFITLDSIVCVMQRTILIIVLCRISSLYSMQTRLTRSSSSGSGSSDNSPRGNESTTYPFSRDIDVTNTVLKSMFNFTNSNNVSILKLQLPNFYCFEFFAKACFRTDNLILVRDMTLADFNLTKNSNIMPNIALTYITSTIILDTDNFQYIDRKQKIELLLSNVSILYIISNIASPCHY
jgi:hypothetical protein